MKFCRVCKQDFDDNATFCTLDGQSLINSVILDDKYRLERRLGEGGMGRVYLATHIHIGTSFAVKVLSPSLVSDQIAVERFRREARASAQIHHPNAVQVTDFGVSKEMAIVYLVMEYLKGTSLRDKISSQKPLDYQEIALILHQICSGLNSAHTKGIIHRDLKPDNIFLTTSEDGTTIVKVLDFGIAKLKEANSETLTSTGMIIGTPHYMSPEQCHGGELDARSDIYSLGIILYQLLVGQVPFSANTALLIIMMQTTKVPPPFAKFRSDIPDAIEKVVMRALEKDPEKRQQSALQLAEEFEQALMEMGLGFADDLSISPEQLLLISQTKKLRNKGNTGNITAINTPTPTAKITTQEQNIGKTKEVPLSNNQDLFNQLQTAPTKGKSRLATPITAIILIVLISSSVAIRWQFFKASNTQSDHPKNVPKPENPILSRGTPANPAPTNTPTEKPSVGGNNNDKPRRKPKPQSQPPPEIEDLGSKTFKIHGSK